MPMDFHLFTASHRHSLGLGRTVLAYEVLTTSIFSPAVNSSLEPASSFHHNLSKGFGRYFCTVGSLSEN